MKSKEELKEWFEKVTQKKQTEGLRISKDLNELFCFMDSNIKRDLESFNILSFTICGSSGRNYKVSPEMQSAFSACTLFERIQFLEMAVEHLVQKQQTSIKLVDDEWELEEVSIKLLKGIKIKEATKIVFKDYSLDCKHFSIDLSRYILRRSKKDQNIYILETIVSQEPPSIRFQLVDNSTLKEKLLYKLKQRVFLKHIDTLNQKVDAPQQIRLLKKKPIQSKIESQAKLPRKDEKSEQNLQSPDRFNDSDKMSLIEELVGRETEGNLNEQIYDYLERRGEQFDRCSSAKLSHSKYHKNRLHVMLPANYALPDLDAYHDFAPETNVGAKGLTVYYSRRNNTFKMEFIINCPKKKVLLHLCQAQNQKLWNKSINQSQVKWNISSENASIAYRKQRIDRDWFKERDFLFVRYLFKKEDSHYIVDRSIESPFFIPFESYHRGEIHHAIYRLDDVSQGTRILLDLKVEYGGLLTISHKKALALAYLRQYVNLQDFISNFKGVLTSTFDYDWQIEDSPHIMANSSFASIASEVFQDGVEQLGGDKQDQEASFYSIVDQMECPERPEVRQVEVTRRKMSVNLQAEEIQFNEEGFSILPKSYLKVYHIGDPTPAKEKRKEVDYQSIMMKKDFISDSNGDMVLANQAKIASQNNVIKYIMSTLKKNLFSGKGILNISLPVEIFNIDSNIQRLCEAMSLAPDFLQKRALKADTLQRFKQCVAFALSNSILYFDIDKPFNPILGETFQGFINGCPVYAQQISHHPPISSVLLIGKGYRVYGNLQAKVYVHLNSGEGVNEGLYTIEFQDGEKILFQTAPGEVSGLAVGNRKYRIKGKMLVLAPKSRLCGVVSFQDESGIFSSKKWKYTDQMEGQILRVSQNYIRKFFSSERGKDVLTPTKKEIEETFAKVSGRWTQQMLIDGTVYYDINTIPYEMVHYRHPLNSNSDYREDLVYRKLNNMARSQQEKERLEIIQRNDRKLREKYHKSSH